MSTSYLQPARMCWIFFSFFTPSCTMLTLKRFIVEIPVACLQLTSFQLHYCDRLIVNEFAATFTFSSKVTEHLKSYNDTSLQYLLLEVLWDTRSSSSRLDNHCVCNFCCVKFKSYLTTWNKCEFKSYLVKIIKRGLFLHRYRSKT